VERDGKFAAAEMCSLDRIHIDSGREAPTFEFEAKGYTVLESASKITVGVLRHGSVATGVSVDYFTEDGTAKSGEDFVAATGTLHFALGESRAEISIEMMTDSAPEGDKHFFVSHGAPCNGGVDVAGYNSASHGVQGGGPTALLRCCRGPLY